VVTVNDHDEPSVFREAVAMPSVMRLLEAALYVDDLERSILFYQSIFGFPILGANKRICALAVAGQQVLLLLQRGGSVQPTPTQGGILPPSDASGQQHIAFAVRAEDVAAWRQRLADSGVAIESHIASEGERLYFRDPDQHSIELATPGTWTIY
jgi:catechol-2,3-dioxygenase